MRATEIRTDLRPGSRLGPRQPEGESGLGGIDSSPRHVDGDPGLPSSLRPPQRQAHLEQIELLQHQPLMGRRLALAKSAEIDVVTRIVDPAQRGGGLGKPALPHQGFGQVARHEIRIVHHCRRNGAPEGSRRNALRSRVIRDDARAGCRVLVFPEQVDLGMGDLAVEAIAAHVPGDADPPALAKRGAQRLASAEPLERHGSGRVADHRLKGAPPPPATRDEVRCQHLADEGRAAPHLELADQGEGSAIVVPAGKAKEQVRDAAKTPLRERLGAPRSHPRQPVDRARQGLLGPGGLAEGAKQALGLPHRRDAGLPLEGRFEAMRDLLEDQAGIRGNGERGGAPRGPGDARLQVSQPVRPREAVLGRKRKGSSDRVDRRRKGSRSHDSSVSELAAARLLSPERWLNSRADAPPGVRAHRWSRAAWRGSLPPPREAQPRW